MILLVSALLLAVAPVIQSDTSHLYESCKAYVRIQDDVKQLHDVEIAPYCLGYSQGYFAGVSAFSGEHPICAAGSNFGTMARVYAAYMDRHPRLFDEREEVGFRLAMLDAYPCPAKP
jgi:hypothetical protein